MFGFSRWPQIYQFHIIVSYSQDFCIFSQNFLYAKIIIKCFFVFPAKKCEDRAERIKLKACSY